MLLVIGFLVFGFSIVVYFYTHIQIGKFLPMSQIERNSFKNIYKKEKKDRTKAEQKIYFEKLSEYIGFIVSKYSFFLSLVLIAIGIIQEYIIK